MLKFSEMANATLRYQDVSALFPQFYFTQPLKDVG